MVLDMRNNLFVHQDMYCMVSFSRLFLFQNYRDSIAIVLLPPIVTPND